jgi:hypothetical protein
MSWWKGNGFCPLAITLVLKLTVVGSTKKRGLTPTALILRFNPGTASLNPASFNGKKKFLGSSIP